MDIRQIYEWVRTELIKHLKTEKALALALGSIPQTFNQRRNHRKAVFVPELFNMFNLLFKLEKKETGYQGPDLLTAVLLDLKSRLKADVSQEQIPLESAPILEKPPYFKRVKEYVARCDEVGKRSGRPCKKTGNEQEICRKSDELEGRTDENLAKELGIGGKDKARSAVKILMAKREDLMQAVEDKVITVNCAETLLATTDADAAELHRVLSKGNKKEIYAFIKERGLSPRE